ncbi:hypothetical protein HMPREF0889_1063 [Megasphaera lornae]|uniref:Uncharacterized protein n=1 Tax=Megasphaera lornae TaxID=1000568 RepID=D3LVQ6_9FIRM|nr:hypothetical protein HMPREF0889_1063 [Megasphaera genomosp. type_1 str. 28L]
MHGGFCMARIYKKTIYKLWGSGWETGETNKRINFTHYKIVRQVAGRRKIRSIRYD